MRGYCPLCKQLLAAPLPPDAPLAAGERARLQVLLAGQAGFAHLVRAHGEQGQRLFPVLAQIQSLMGVAFFTPTTAESAAELAAAVGELRADLLAWLGQADALAISPVMPPAADLGRVR